MSHPSFCRQCGTPLKPQSQFCPKCGKVVTTVLPPSPQVFEPSPQPIPPSPPPTQPSDKVWGIDKRFFIIALVVLVLVLPIFPRQTTIYVDGQTATTTVYQSTSYVTSSQVYVTTTQNSIPVYVGHLEQVSDQYYYQYQYYYSQCYWDAYGNLICYYTQWPYYQSYVNTVTLDPSDQIVKREIVQESGGLASITLTSYDGQSQVFRHVVSYDLTKTGTSTVQTTVTLTNTFTNSIVNPATTVSTVDCQKCVPQQITEHVSILQMLFGF